MLISICIATYNRHQFIEETLRSILSQDTSNTEILIFDSSEGTNTLSIVKKINSPIIRYIKNDHNGGLDQDFDKCVRLAKGEFCWLFSDDDIFLPNSLANIKNTLNDHVDLVIVNSEIRDKKLDRTITKKQVQINKDMKYKNLENFFLDCGKYLSFIGCVIIRKKSWITRNTTNYYGDNFIHVGVIFESEFDNSIIFLNEPMIALRYGNGFWTDSGFEVWNIIWPKIIHSLNFKKNIKSQIALEFPFKDFKNLVYYRSIGAFGKSEYHKFIGKKTFNSKAFLISRMPLSIIHFMSVIFVKFFKNHNGTIKYDLIANRKINRINRMFARICFNDFKIF